MVLRPKLLPSKLSETQARQVLHTIQFPGFVDESTSRTAPFPSPNLLTLSLLQIHFLTTFPFESLSLNYEPNGSMSSLFSDVYSRFITNRHGGGYCLQVNPLYRELLAFLKFRLIGCLGRVNAPDGWTGFTHTTTLVYLPSHLPQDKGKTVYYMTDVGFGSSPLRPILLRDGHEEFGRGKEKFKLIKNPLQPRSSFEKVDEEEADVEVEIVGKRQEVWKLQVNKATDKGWEDCYQFTTTECFDPDYQASNKATSHHQSVPFAVMIIVVRYILNPDLLHLSKNRVKEDGLTEDLYPYHPSIVEQRMIVGDRYIVKVGEKETVNKKIEGEKERVELLKSDFDLLKHVSVEEAVDEIKGKPSALKIGKERNGTLN